MFIQIAFYIRICYVTFNLNCSSRNKRRCSFYHCSSNSNCSLPSASRLYLSEPQRTIVMVRYVCDASAIGFTSLRLVDQSTATHNTYADMVQMDIEASCSHNSAIVIGIDCRSQSVSRGRRIVVKLYSCGSWRKISIALPGLTGQNHSAIATTYVCLFVVQCGNITVKVVFLPKLDQREIN